MGRVTNSIISGTSGRTGRVVIAKVNGVEISRERPGKRTKPPTASQLLHQQKFGFAIGFLSGYRSYAKTFFGHKAGLKSCYNMAVANVIDAIGMSPEEEFTVDCNKIMFSKGPLPEMEPVSVLLPEPLTLSIAWTDNSEEDPLRQTDQLQILYYSATEDKARLKLTTVARTEETYSFMLLPKFGGEEVHVWAAFKAADDTAASDSVYLGSVTVNG